MQLFLYGPPGSGKSTLGKALAGALDLPFIDLDRQIEAEQGRSIRQIFASGGEPAFRALEQQALNAICGQDRTVIALGGGALMDESSRAAAETHGQVLFLQTDPAALMARMGSGPSERPLLAGQTAERMSALLAERGAHYDTFRLRMDTTRGSLEELVQRAQMLLGYFRLRGMGEAYDAIFEAGGLQRLGEHLRSRGLRGPIAVVSDSHIGPLYLKPVLRSLEDAGFRAAGYCMPSGEAYKNVETLQRIWDFFVDADIERGSTVIALGGGVVGDLTGFAAATFLRGVAWVNMPTSLLAMVDSSLGGKTGLDLPQAKNLVGAFYPPRLVLADPLLLQSLPEREVRGGLAEVVKHGVIDDVELFELCETGWANVSARLEQVARQAAAVKARVIEADPYEKHLRQVLNLGHTVGHGVELASDYRLSHGEAVAVGMVAEARISETLGIAEPGLAKRIAAALTSLGLPAVVPTGLQPERIVQAARLDKKRAGGSPRFALPVRIGEVRPGVKVDDWQSIVLGELRSQESDE